LCETAAVDRGQILPAGTGVRLMRQFAILIARSSTVLRRVLSVKAV
jgi:hypothetical protein